MRIAIMPNHDKTEAINTAKDIISFLKRYNISFSVPRVFENTIKGNNISYYATHLAAIEKSDIVIAIGGDGTIIHIAKHAATLNKPILGVNCGRVGFVANLEPADIPLLSKLFDRTYSIDERMMLEVSVFSKNRANTLYALNDVTVSRGSLSRMVELDVKYNGEFINSYRSDGLILSTPTGSTAYSLSAGGPVIEPHMKCILLTPVCPHSLFTRSVLFSDDSQVSVMPNERCDADIFVTADGIQSFKIDKSDSITVKRSKLTADFIKLNNKNFYRILNDKLTERRT